MANKRIPSNKSQSD